MSIARRIPLGLVFFLLALAVLDLILVPGSIAERAAPCVAAAAWGWLIRSQVYGRVRVLEPTDAGFRPPSRIAFSRTSRKFARNCLTSAWQYQDQMAKERAEIETAIGHFSDQEDVRMLAWCLARGVDYNLRTSALDEAESMLGRTASYPGIADEPCLRAAWALFGRATGSGSETTFAEAERLCRENRRRVPYRLRTLRAESGMAWAGRGEHQRWTGRARAYLAWNREYATVLQDILTASFPLERRDPELAIGLALRVDQLVDGLGKDSTKADLTPQEAVSLQLVKAAARERVGEILAAHERFREAAAAYAHAVALYRQFRYRPRAGFAAVRASVLALRAGLPDSVQGESRLLTALLTGLQAMEYDRGRLRDQQYRSGLLASREVLYSEVFAVLAERVTANHAMAAEIALWLLESVHRNALAENIQAVQQTAGRTGGESRSGDLTDEALRRLREPADVAGIRQVVTGRVALYYRCERTSDGWQISTVLVAPTGITLHRALLRTPDPGVPKVTAMRKLPGALLDELASGDAARVEFVHRFVSLRTAVWAQLAAALMPPELGDVLGSLESGNDPAVLLVVPDGPLSSVPFAGLRLPDGSLLADHAAVVFMPNLLSFSANDWDGEPEEACITVAHFGPTKFRDAFDALRSTPAYAPMRMEVRAAADRGSFVAALREVPPPRIAVISHHGETAENPADRYINFEGGGKLSERDARTIDWPQTVVLGSCWASDITVRAGDDPAGLPTACLLGGARAVLGGQSRVDNDETSARILARVTLEAALGRHPALTLTEAIREHLAERPADRDAPPGQWANVTIWTSRAPAGPRPVTPSWASWTTQLTARAPGEDSFAAFDMALLDKDPAARTTTRSLSVPIGAALRRALEHASSGQPGVGPLVSVTSLDLLAAIFDTDNADWPSFTVAADLPAFPSRRESSRENNLAASVITLDSENRVRVTRSVSGAIACGERLAAHLGDAAISPAHVVYGFLCDETCDASRWMAIGASGPSTLLQLLSDRVFGVDLPSASALPPLKEKTGPSSQLRPRVARRRVPGTSREVFDLITAGGQHAREVLTTFDFASAMAAADSTVWRQLTEHGFRLSPPDDVPFGERDRGGQEVSLGHGYLATVSPEFSDAFRKARALAWHLGDPEVTSAHVLYGIVTDHDSDAARWLQPAKSDSHPPSPGQSAVTVLADHVFLSPLPQPHRLPAAPPPPGPKSSNWWLLLLPALLLGMLCMRIRRKTRGSIVGWLILAIIVVTMALADINTATANSTQLAVEQPALTGTVSLPAQPDDGEMPATLIGSLSTFYIAPTITGLTNQVRNVFSGWGHPPGDLSGTYLFALPAPPHPPGTSDGWLAYRGARYRAHVTCQGQVAQTLCFAVVRIPGNAGPNGFTWGDESYSNVGQGTEMSQTAVVYQGGGMPWTVGRADIAIYRETPDGSDIIEVRDQAGQDIRPGSPVVLDDRSRVLPLFGVAIQAKSGPWDAVYPIDLLNLYSQGIAERLAGSAPGAEAYAGVVVSALPGDLPGPALVTTIGIGGPADDAGILAGDEIQAIDGRAVTSPAEMVQLLSSYQPGQTVDVTILRRNGRDYAHRDIKLTLGYRPVGA
ncbi:MAG TPA: CHAT domain-containing protein [Streptosporangiaceae bacterium]